MNFEIILILGTLIIVVGLVILFFIRRLRPRSTKETDYRAIFNMGIIFFCAGLAIGIATQMVNPLFVLGLIYITIGIVNKDKWKIGGDKKWQ